MPAPRHPRRPPRLPTVFDAYRDAPVYFVTFCTHERKPRLARTNVHEAFLAFIHRGWDEQRIAVGRYVIMPDHVHLLVSGGADFNLGEWVKLLKQCLGKATNASRRDAATPDTATPTPMRRPNTSRRDVATPGKAVRTASESTSHRDVATPGSRLWQEGFFDHLIRGDEKLGSVWEYVRKNPETAGLAEAPEDWPYQGEFVVLERQ
jgi:putative transposase